MLGRIREVDTGSGDNKIVRALLPCIWWIDCTQLRYFANRDWARLPSWFNDSPIDRYPSSSLQSSRAKFMEMEANPKGLRGISAENVLSFLVMSAFQWLSIRTAE